MKLKSQTMKDLISVLFLLTVMVSCATLPELKVAYRLPPRSGDLKGNKVFLSFLDNRTVKDIIGEGARDDYKNFSGKISFSLARDEEEGFKIGLYDLPSLFTKVFKTRLEELGVEVVSEKGKGETEVVIVLKDFLLELFNGKWIFTMGYEARLVKGEKVLARQMISGQGERLKLVGRSQADAVLGEVFTEVINKLDAERLFQQAEQ